MKIEILVKVIQFIRKVMLFAQNDVIIHLLLYSTIKRCSNSKMKGKACCYFDILKIRLDINQRGVNQLVFI